MEYGTLGTQKYLNKTYGAGLDEDGDWGPLTQEAYDFHVMKRRVIMRAESPFPRDREAEVTAFYGPHGIPGGRTPKMELVEVPFKLYVYGNRSVTLEAIYVNEACAGAWAGALREVWSLYGESQVDLDETTFSSWYGCYNPRPRRGSKSWSLHAWAVPNDFGSDNEHNPMRTTRRGAQMPEEIMDAMEKHYIINLGRYAGYDFPHFEAIKP